MIATGSARLRIAGREIALQRPRLERRDEAWQLLPPATRIPPGVSAESLLLLMDATPEA